MKPSTAKLIQDAATSHWLTPLSGRFGGIDFITGAAFALSPEILKEECKNEWIDVKEGLPEIPKPYFDKDWDGMVKPVNTNVIVFDGEYVFESSYSEGRGFDGNKSITHWQPLPQPPVKNTTNE